MATDQESMTPRAAAEAIIARLRERGHEALLAGGCVRDELLGHEPKDFDVATDAHPDQIAGHFRKTAAVGAAFGVMLVRDFGTTVEVATFRADGPYSDSRRPDSVEFGDAELDAQRRDFTINALFIDPLASGDDRVIDYVGGREDLIRRTLRAVGDPEKRLAEDHLRALRAVRFAARYELSIEQGTADAIREHAKDLEGVSRERIGEEMRRMLTHEHRVRACELLHELHLARAVFGRVAEFDPRAMLGLPAGASYPAALMGLLIARGHDPAVPHGDVIVRARKALLLSNDERDALRAGFNALERLIRRWDGLEEAGRKRLASDAGFSDALAVFGSLNAPGAASVESEVRALSERFGGLAPDPFLNGEALIGLGLKPGPGFADLLAKVYDAQLEGRVTDAESARAFAAGVVRDGPA